MSTSYPPPPGEGEPQRPGEPPQDYGGYAVPPGGSAPPPPPPPPDGGYGQAPAYGPGPAGGPSGPPAARPPAMDQAVRLMQVGGIIALIGVVVGLFSRGTIRDAIAKANETATGSKLSESQIDAAATASFAFAIVVGLVGAGLWFWMARANGNGRKWARTVATVFFVLSLLSLFGSLVQTEPIITRLLGVVQFLVGAAAIYFLYRKESTAFYAARSAPRY